MIKELVIELGLHAPLSFFETEELTLNLMIGGCGPGKIGDALVPDTIYGLNITPACAIHDYEYSTGKSTLEKQKADFRFLCNILIIINKKSKFGLVRWVRRYRAMSYYSAVADGGNQHFVKSTLQ